MSILNIRSWADVRAFAYVLLPVVATLLVSLGVFDDAQAAQWSALVTAVLGPVIAAVAARDVSTARAAVYAVLAAVQALTIGYDLLSGATWDQWLPLITAVVGISGGGVAAANTDTTGPTSDGPPL